MLIDTHCHLNFKAYKGKIDFIIDRANQNGVEKIIVPGVDIVTSQLAVKLADKYNNVYASVGIHPHHSYEIKKNYQVSNSNFQLITNNQLSNHMNKLKELLQNKKVVGIGEVGFDLYEYQQTKYNNYEITPEFIKMQKQLFELQIDLAIDFNKALILHNRKAVNETLLVLEKKSHKKLREKTVFHCCEADERLLEFAKTHKFYIGIDGDLSWSKKKQRFIKKVPLNMLVLETDSPYLKPKLNSNWPKAVLFPKNLEAEKYNEPKNIVLIRDLVATVKGIKSEQVEKQTSENAHQLFSI